ncbi:zinc protease [Desulfonatronum thiosulfatophilum]|uniref:Zinc protease n=1 Tax=Desulfonatronum thiosulfatophilum TaxID=617002 RepID=A0A1G6E216_9BACT|nr:pitrilysin family protein [Desulfonatronum thiosulfatophilum]SDB51489.1 zinc protease [Desulfonatronum thiosulfatophilum]
MQRLFTLFVVFFWLAVSPLVVSAEVVEHRLDNGLTVLVLPDQRAPVVTNQIWYGVGAMHEHSGITGISHMLEHMMFRGSEKYPPGEFTRIISEIGGSQNAFTGPDFTGYYQVVGTQHWEMVMSMEAERMFGLKLTEEEFQPERNVVIEERRLTREDRPIALLNEHFMATAFFNSPYGHTAIGWMTDIQAYTLEDLQAWYEMWYVPNNAVAVVVGDVDPEEVIAAAERYYGPIPARPLPEIKPRTEAPQRGERRITLRVPAEMPYLIMGWKTPVLLTLREHGEDSLESARDAYALMVAAGVLSSGHASRLDRELVRGRELARAANAGYSAFSRMDSLFTLSAMPSTGTDLQTLEEALLEQAEVLRSEPVTEQELQRVKAQVIAAMVYRRDSLNAQAFELGMLETIGLGWRTIEEYAEGIREVTAEDVLRVAQKYLIPDTRTVAVLDPLPLDAPVRESTAIQAQ